MPKYIVSQPAITLCSESRSSRSPTTTSAPMSRNACARSSSFRTIARTVLPCFNSSSVTVRPTAPTRPAAPVTRMEFPMFLLDAFCSLRKGFQFGQNGWEKFRNRRMNMHCVLYNRIRRLRIHDVQQNVNYFIASDPKNRGTNNMFCFGINRDFDKTLRLTFLNGPAHPAHRKFRREGSAPRLPYFVVRHAASAERRICKQSIRLDSV